jgi:hypothetical protein
VGEPPRHQACALCTPTPPRPAGASSRCTSRSRVRSARWTSSRACRSATRHTTSASTQTRCGGACLVKGGGGARAPPTPPGARAAGEPAGVPPHPRPLTPCPAYPRTPPPPPGHRGGCEAESPLHRRPLPARQGGCLLGGVGRSEGRCRSQACAVAEQPSPACTQRPHPRAPSPLPQAIDLIDEAGSRARIAAFSTRKQEGRPADPKVAEYLQASWGGGGRAGAAGMRGGAVAGSRGDGGRQAGGRDVHQGQRRGG